MLNSIVLCISLCAVLSAAAPVIEKETVQDKNVFVLADPDIEFCLNRTANFEYNGKKFVVYGEYVNPSTGFPIPVKMNWLDARNVCRRQCMDSISMDTHEEYLIILHFMRDHNIDAAWTSGRLCDFKGCPDEENPNRIRDWFWSSIGKYIPDVTYVPNKWNINPWNTHAETGAVQPDNFEFKHGGKPENCLAALEDNHHHAVMWHYFSCDQELPVMCEDSEELLNSLSNAMRYRGVVKYD